MTFVIFSDLNEDQAKVYESWDSYRRTQSEYELDSDITHAWSDEGGQGRIVTIEAEAMQHWLKELEADAIADDRQENSLRYSGN